MLPSVLTEAIASGEVVRRDGTRRPLVGNVSRAEAERIHDVVRALRPEVSVEIGLAHGMSALAIAQALHENGRGVHHAVDPFQDVDWEAIGVANLERAGLADLVHVHTSFPEDALAEVPSVGFAFIDASHLFDLTLLEFVLVDKHLDVGGVIGFHDLWMPSLQKVARYVLTNRSYHVYDDLPGRTDAVSWKRHLLHLARRVPSVDRIVRPEILYRLPDLGIRGTLLFIEKTADDHRDWRFHRDF